MSDPIKPANYDPARMVDIPPIVAAALERMHDPGDGGIFARIRNVLRGKRSQRQWAKELGVFQQNVNRYENGTVPHPDFLIHLALLENVDIHWLLLGDHDPHEARPYRPGGKGVAGKRLGQNPVDVSRFLPPSAQKRPVAAPNELGSSKGTTR